MFNIYFLIVKLYVILAREFVMKARAARKGHQPARDSIAAFVRAWKRERPDLDPWPLSILGRINRLSGHLLRRAEEWLAPFGLGWESFSLIVTLRRAGPPFELRPSDFYRESLLTSGAITNRIDRVEAVGLVRRVPDPKDRRGVIVRLTPQGRELADRAIEHHFAALTKLLSALSAAERETLARLLCKLLCSIEKSERQSRAVSRGVIKPRRHIHRPHPVGQEPSVPRTGAG